MNEWPVRGYRARGATSTRASSCLLLLSTILPFPSPRSHPQPGSQSSSPQTAWPGILFIFTMNVLLSGRQSKPRNGIRLSFVYFSFTLRILSLANSPSWFTKAGHDKKSHLKKKKRAIIFPDPIKLP